MALDLRALSSRCAARANRFQAQACDGALHGAGSSGTLLQVCCLTRTWFQTNTEGCDGHLPMALDLRAPSSRCAFCLGLNHRLELCWA